MRKALIGLMMAATVLTPIAAQAQETQDVDRDGNQARYERQAQRNAQRYEQRQQRQQARQVRQAEPAQQQQQVQQQQAAPTQYVQRQRGGGEWRRGDRQRGGQVQQQVQQQQVQEQAIQRQQAQRDGAWRRNRQLPSTTGWQGSNDPNLRDEANRYDRRARENAVRYGTRQQRQEVRDQRGDWRQDRRSSQRDWSRDWSRNNWRNDRRYNWQDWRYRNSNIFRLSPYYSPYRNHRYSRFSIGIFLDSLFYDQRYWIGDPWQYRLPAAPYGTQWVRYYDDVLLVDVYTGEVVDVIYDFFW